MTGDTDIVSGTLVKIAEGYANGGTEGSIYRYLGEDPATLDLSTQDYSDEDLWEEQQGTLSGGNAITVTLAFNSVGWEPQNLLFNTLDALLGDPLISDAMDNGEGAGAKAYLLDSTVAATGQLSVTATNAGAISSDISNTSTSNAEAWTGANGFSFGGVIASNKVSAAAEASIDWTAGYVGTRSIIADDGIAVSANNAADLSASIELDVSSETVNNALDGNNLAASDAIGISGAVSYNDVRGGATAFINRAGVLDTAGNLTVEARNSSTFDALVSSSAHSSGGNIFGGGASTAISPVVSTNTVQGDSEAYISNSTIGTNGPIGGDVNIYALNDIDLTAETNNRTTSAGLSVSVTLAFNTLGWEPQNILFNLVDALIGSSEIADAFDGDTGAGAKAYLFDSTVDATGSLSVTADASATLDSLVTNVADSVSIAYTNATSAGYGVVVSLNKVSSEAEATIGWSDTYVGAQDISANGGIAVEASDNAVIDATIDLPVTSVAGNHKNAFSASDSSGFGGAIALNDVRGGANAFIDDAELSSSTGGVTVTALANAQLDASLEIAVQSMGGSEVGTGAPLAAGGLIATNTVQGGAEAYIVNSTLGTAAAPLGGDVSIDADNTSQINAHVVNAVGSGEPLLDTSVTGDTDIVSGTLVKIAEGYANGGTEGGIYRYLGEDPATLDLSTQDYSDEDLWEEQQGTLSGGNAITVTLAFNSVGWEPQNLLFNTLDALLGDPLISDAMDNGEGAGAKAYLLDSTVAATGQLSVTATNAGAISSDISNTSTSNAEAWTGANGFSFGGVIASNKVSAAAEASIDWTAGYVGTRSIIADDGIAVSANNAADLSASIELDVSSETVNNALDGNNLAASDAIGISGAVSYNDVRGGATAFINRAGVLDTAGNLTVEARNSSTFDALVSSSAHSSGGNIFGGGASTAISPVVSTNTVQGDSEAYISNSTIGTNGPIGGDVNIYALNDIDLTAETNNRTTSAGLSVSVTLAFNTLAGNRKTSCSTSLTP